MNICDFIPVGRENAIRRADLVQRVNLPDRTVRHMIEDARRQGAFIMNAQDGAGYYISEDLGELKRQLKRNENRALSILAQQKHLRRKVEEIEAKESGQVLMPFEFKLDIATPEEALQLTDIDREWLALLRGANPNG